MKVPVNRPLLNGNESAYLMECISTGWISSEGPFVSKFESESGNFISTLGGYYKPGEFLNLNEDVYDVNLEFNSNYDQDSIKSLSIVKTSKWKNISKSNDILKGKWVMSGRYNNGEFRTRNTDLPRKTMKILIDGFFQWIAFNTETFKFSGSGGGEYETIEGKYIEIIQYFFICTQYIVVLLLCEFIYRLYLNFLLVFLFTFK